MPPILNINIDIDQTRRPVPFPARLYVRGATRRALPVVAEELSHWTPATRLHSARLLRVLLLFHGRHALPHLGLLVPAIVKGLLQVEERGQGEEESSGSGAGPILLGCAGLLGRLIQGIGGEQSPERVAFEAVVEGLLEEACSGGGREASAARARAVAAVRSVIRI